MCTFCISSDGDTAHHSQSQSYLLISKRVVIAETEIVCKNSHGEIADWIFSFGLLFRLLYAQMFSLSSPFFNIDNLVTFPQDEGEDKCPCK
jgi:hypothetical protein